MYDAPMRRITITLEPDVEEWLDDRAALAKDLPQPLKQQQSYNRIINRALKRMAWYCYHRFDALCLEEEDDRALLPFMEFITNNPAILDVPFMAALDAKDWPKVNDNNHKYREHAEQLWDRLHLVDRFILQEWCLNKIAERRCTAKPEE
jgi:hypothetical protein